MLGNRILPLAESETGQNHSWHRTEYIHRPGWIYTQGESVEEKMASSCPARVKMRTLAQVDEYPLNISTKTFAYTCTDGR